MKQKITMYVGGLMFSPDHKQVALIKKNRPEAQAGLYNAIGGKIEKDENAHQAMMREFEEETGYLAHDWYHICVLKNHHYMVLFMHCIGPLHELKTTTDETIEIIDIENLQQLRVVKPLKTVINLVLEMKHEDLGFDIILNVS